MSGIYRIFRSECQVFAAIMLVGSCLALVASAEAQTFKTIYSFSQTYPILVTNYGGFWTNSDGAEPWCTLSLSGNTLYGTATSGGLSGEGTIFKLNTDGSDFTSLHNFSLAVDVTPINGDGIIPEAGLTLAGNTLYGTAYSGGSAANGTVFSLTTNGDNFETLYSFTAFMTANRTNSDGANPLGLVVSGNVIYGEAYGGGPRGGGTVFRMNTDGSGFATFDSLTNGPTSALVLSNNVLYGTTVGGGSSNNGTVFSMHVDGTGLTVLYSFTGGTDGAYPRAGVLLSGNVMYGTTTAGGAFGQGTVFKLNLDGTGLVTLYSFTNAQGPVPNPGALVLLGHNLFGMAAIFPQAGALYTLNTNGTGFTVLHTFAGPGDSSGGQPYGGLTASGSTLYGTTSLGGTFDNGTVFSFSLLPHLAIVASVQNVILTWPTNFAGFDYTGYTLQSTTNLVSPVWNTNLPAPVVVNGQNTVTNPVSGTQQFFRLSQ